MAQLQTEGSPKMSSTNSAPPVDLIVAQANAEQLYKTAVDSRAAADALAVGKADTLRKVQTANLCLEKIQQELKAAELSFDNARSGLEALRLQLLSAQEELRRARISASEAEHKAEEATWVVHVLSHDLDDVSTKTRTA